MGVNGLLVGIGALISLVFAARPRLVLPLLRRNIEAFGCQPPDDAALMLFIRVVGIVCTLVFGFNLIAMIVL